MGLSVENDEQRQKLVTQLSQLRSSAGWKIITSLYRELLAETERGIFTIGGNEMKFSDKDILTMRREIILDLLSKPEKLISDLVPVKAVPTDDYDPFS